MSEEKLLSVDEVAHVLNVSPVTVKRYARECLLSATMVGKDYFFNESEVENYKKISEQFSPKTKINKH